MTTSSSNYTGLYGGGTTTAIPNTAYGNANVVSLLAAGSDGANTVGNVSATGNITTGGILTDNYYYANGAPFSGGGSTYGNSNVTTLLAGFGSNSISTTGNVAASYFSGDGSQLSNINAGNIIGTYGNANVVNLMANFGSNTISSTGNVTAGNVLTPGVVSVTGNIRGGNVNTAGQLSATGNVTAAYHIGDGSLLTNITGANVSGTVANATYAVSAGSATTATTAGTVTTAAQPNITSVGTLTSLSSSGNISAAGNITGSYFFGNGSLLTGIASSYGNSNVATFLANFGSNTISTTGNVTGGNILSGTFQAVNSGGGSLKNASGTNQLQWGGGGGNNITLEVATNITPANAAVAISPTGTGTVAIAPVGGGAINNMIIGNVTPAAVNATTVSASGNITGSNVVTAGNVTGSYFIGNGSQLTGITATLPSTISVTGNITGGNLLTTGVLTASGGVSTSSITSGGITSIGNILVSGPAGSGQISATGNIISNGSVIGVDADFGGNLLVAGGITATGSTMQIGNVNSTGAVNVTGRIFATANITGGNLISNAAVIASSVNAATIGNTGASLIGATVSTTGNITTSGNFVGNGAALTGITTSPAGSNTQVQFNAAGAVAGNSNFLYDYTNNRLTAGLVRLGDGANTLSTINSLNIPSWATPNTTNPGRVIVGPGFNGDYSTTYDPLSITRGSQFAVIGNSIAANTDTVQSQRQMSSLSYVNLNGGTLNSSTRRLASGGFGINIGNGVAQLPTNGALSSFAGIVVSATAGNIGGIAAGNANVSHYVGSYVSVNSFAGSNIGNAIGVLANPAVSAATGNIYNYVAYGISQGGTAGQPTPLRVYGLYNPDNIGSFGFANGNTARAATNYYFLYNEDNVARNRMGSLETYTEYAQQAGTSGSVTIDKNAGQVQQLNLTGNATLTYSNFVTSASDSVNTDYQADTVTLIINQGTTGGYGVTFPTPSSVYKYAGNITALQTTAANSVSMVSVTAVYMNSQATYLTTISPGFV